jgi:hypothetical protein
VAWLAVALHFLYARAARCAPTSFVPLRPALRPVAAVAGSSIVFEDEASLSAEVLPLYYRHSNYLSLLRQLTFYQFRRVSKSSRRRVADAVLLYV